LPELFRLPDSGQTRCYDEHGEVIAPAAGDRLYGQDGCFAAHPFAYTKLDGDGRPMPSAAAWDDGYRMVRDENTGLVWEIKSPRPGDVNHAGDEYTWEEARGDYVGRLNARQYGGRDDWRLPNQDELRSIVDYGRCDPAVDPRYFPECRPEFFWSAVPYAMQPEFAWGIFFGLGSGIAYGRGRPACVRAVRGGRCDAFGHAGRRRLVDHGDGTVTDLDTGLMWQQGENERMTWFEALRACAGLRLAGHDDWRLPGIKELNTILNLGYEDGWWYHRRFFPADGLKPPLLHYFSSTSFQHTYAWVTNFCFGYDGYYASKSAKLLFRAVRAARPAPDRPVGIAPPGADRRFGFVPPVPDHPTGIARLAPERPVGVTRPTPERSARGAPPPPDLPAGFTLPDSGQRLCFDDEGRRIPVPGPGERFHGQDGCRAPRPARYTGLGPEGEPLPAGAAWHDGCRSVREERTGLTWELHSPDPADTCFAGRDYTWQEAREHVARLNRSRHGGFADWRLPHREELRALADYAGHVPAIDRGRFPLCRPAFYWSCDAYAEDESRKWGIYFGYGCAICFRAGNRYPVRAVRGGLRPAFGDPGRYAFRDNGDGTVSDLVTGLMWKQEESPEANWEDALRFCASLELASHTDWRLPDLRELATLVDLGRSDGAWFHRRFFPGVKTAPLGFYWASTTHGESFGWGVNFQFGYDGYYAGKKHGRYPFRPVRTEERP